MFVKTIYLLVIGSLSAGVVGVIMICLAAAVSFAIFRKMARSKTGYHGVMIEAQHLIN